MRATRSRRSSSTKRSKTDAQSGTDAFYTSGARLERYEIHGQDISAYMEGVSGGTVIFEGEESEIVKGPTGGAEEQNRYFIDCVKNDVSVGPPAADLAEAVKTMELAHQILSGTR